MQLYMCVCQQTYGALTMSKYLTGKAWDSW